MAKKKPTAKEDDKNLFDRVMQEVQPLSKRPPPRHRFMSPTAETAPAKNQKTKKKPPSSPKPAVTKPTPAAIDNPGIDKRQAERLRRGQVQIDGRLDLHGMKQQEAHDRLREIIFRSYDRGQRCLLVITGKGNRRRREDASFMPDHDLGVLKRNVPRWLQEPGLRDKVLSVSEAQARHGGSGALYVLLRRRRT